MAAKTKSLVKTGCDERFEWTAEITPGQSIRIRGRAKAGQVATDRMRLITTHPDMIFVGDESGEMRLFRNTVLAAASRVSGDVLNGLASLWTSWHRRNLPEGILTDAISHDLGVEIGDFIPAGVNALAACLPLLNTIRGQSVFDDIWQGFDWTFYAGEQCVTGSYNLIYTDAITGITAASVTYHDDCENKTRRLSLAKFVALNWNYDKAHIERHNSREMMHI